MPVVVADYCNTQHFVVAAVGVAFEVEVNYNTEAVVAVVEIVEADTQTEVALLVEADSVVVLAEVDTEQLVMDLVEVTYYYLVPLSLVDLVVDSNNILHLLGYRVDLLEPSQPNLLQAVAVVKQEPLLPMVKQVMYIVDFTTAALFFYWLILVQMIILPITLNHNNNNNLNT